MTCIDSTIELFSLYTGISKILQATLQYYSKDKSIYSLGMFKSDKASYTSAGQTCIKESISGILFE